MDATDHGIVAALDTNGDGLIDIDDVPTEMAAAILDKMDTSGDGRISIEDLPEGGFAPLAPSVPTLTRPPLTSPPPTPTPTPPQTPRQLSPWPVDLRPSRLRSRARARQRASCPRRVCRSYR